MNRFLLTSLSILAVAALSPAPANAEEFNDAQKAEIKKMFDEYLLNSGEKVLKSVNTYQAELEAKDRAEANQKAKEFMAKVKTQKDLPMAGNPDGDITIVEFFDYNCGYCHKALNEIQTVLKDDDKVKVIFMDMPILSEASVEAAKWSVAAQKQDKYFEYHQAIMGHKGSKDEENMVKLAKKIGLDTKQLKEDKESDATEALVNERVKIAQDLGIRGTPGFVINGELFPGYIPAGQIKDVISKARAK